MCGNFDWSRHRDDTLTIHRATLINVGGRLYCVKLHSTTVCAASHVTVVDGHVTVCDQYRQHTTYQNRSSLSACLSLCLSVCTSVCLCHWPSCMSASMSVCVRATQQTQTYRSTDRQTDRQSDKCNQLIVSDNESLRLYYTHTDTHCESALYHVHKLTIPSVMTIDCSNNRSLISY